VARVPGASIVPASFDAASSTLCSFAVSVRSIPVSFAALSLWWHDTTARVLGQQNDELTVRLLDTPSVNQLDHSGILPGDLAVTRNGVHVMAYLGDSRWIEADPGVGRVITVHVPAEDNEWFRVPMSIVRWSVLSG